jgi:hypothetical protein
VGLARVWLEPRPAGVPKLRRRPAPAVAAVGGEVAGGGAARWAARQRPGARQRRPAARRPVRRGWTEPARRAAASKSKNPSQRAPTQGAIACRQVPPAARAAARAVRACPAARGVACQPRPRHATRRAQCCAIAAPERLSVTQVSCMCGAHRAPTPRGPRPAGGGWAARARCCGTWFAGCDSSSRCLRDPWTHPCPATRPPPSTLLYGACLCGTGPHAAYCLGGPTHAGAVGPGALHRRPRVGDPRGAPLPVLVPTSTRQWRVGCAALASAKHEPARALPSPPRPRKSMQQSLREPVCAGVRSQRHTPCAGTRPRHRRGQRARTPTASSSAATATAGSSGAARRCAWRDRQGSRQQGAATRGVDRAPCCGILSRRCRRWRDWSRGRRGSFHRDGSVQTRPRSSQAVRRV